MFFTHFGNGSFSLLRTWILYGESDGMEIRITDNQSIKNMTLGNKAVTQRSFIEMRQMTLNDPKFDIKNC